MRSFPTAPTHFRVSQDGKPTSGWLAKAIHAVQKTSKRNLALQHLRLLRRSLSGRFAGEAGYSPNSTKNQPALRGPEFNPVRHVFDFSARSKCCFFCDGSMLAASPATQQRFVAANRSILTCPDCRACRHKPDSGDMLSKTGCQSHPLDWLFLLPLPAANRAPMSSINRAASLLSAQNPSHRGTNT
ncbi:hypothetical protein N657DRAFT_51145 [Parathielavia appendiculata]|uniref:Uncharacterized protein n=1 Tax=Parathielavia appendiculata TaxID=2587402 RepID=A0AAN6Z8K8_9PEZI|nr:hypothetical protein N657DRAFT_51145 [Parathielavia appendiculata]